MKKRSGRSWFRAGTAALLCLLSFFLGCQRPTGRPAETKGGDTDPPRRIVSVVPSVTETLFALGLGDRVVGVSDFCRYPPEARELPKLGGMHNTNLERIVELRPDLAVLLREHHELKEKLEKVQIATLSVDHSSIAGILDSFEEIADGCGVGEAGRKLRHQTEERLEALRPEPEKEPVRVLIVLDRDLGERNITQVYAAGKNRYFNSRHSVPTTHVRRRNGNPSTDTIGIRSETGLRRYATAGSIRSWPITPRYRGRGSFFSPSSFQTCSVPTKTAVRKRERPRTENID